jgi:hypothetical protein
MVLEDTGTILSFGIHFTVPVTGAVVLDPGAEASAHGVEDLPMAQLGVGVIPSALDLVMVASIMATGVEVL